MRALNFPPKPQVTQSRKVEVIFLAEHNRKRLQIALKLKKYHITYFNINWSNTSFRIAWILTVYFLYFSNDLDFEMALGFECKLSDVLEF